MRIAMLTNNYKPFIGGVPISIERLAQGLRELGHVVYIFAPSYENQEEEPYVIRYKSCKKKMDGGMYIPNIFDREIEDQFRLLQFDVIHVHHPMLIGYTALYLGKKYKIPVTFTYHTRYEQYLHYLKPYGKLMQRYRQERFESLRKMEEKVFYYSTQVVMPGYTKWFANQCDLVFAPTPMMRDYLLEQGTDTPIQVLPTGLNRSYFDSDERVSRELRNKLGAGKPYVFCTIARLAKEKNLDFLMDTMFDLKQRFGSRFRLLVIGDGPEREHLQSRIGELGLMDQVLLLGNVPNEQIKYYCKACDLFLFASKSETQGIVLLEAMAAQVPVIAVKASGVVDVVKNGRNGYMVTESREEMVDKICRTLENPVLYDQLSQGAQETAWEYLNTNIARRAEAGYQDAIAWNMRRGYRHAMANDEA